MNVSVIKVNAEKNTVSLRGTRTAGRVLVETNYWVRAINLADWVVGESITLTTEELEGLNEIE